MPRAEILISELASQVLAGPVQSAAAPGVWRAVPYRAGDIHGTLLGCGESTAPAPITLRLGATGNYRIWLGLPVLIGGRPLQVRVRLSDDLCCMPLSAMRPWEEASQMVEVHWKDADLSSQDLILEGVYDPQPQRGALGWVRLEPIEQLPATPQRAVKFPLVLTEDGHGVFCAQPHQRPEDILEHYEHVPEGTALKIMLWSIAGADVVTYPTKVGQVGMGHSLDYDLPGYAMLMRNLDLWIKNGWDSLQVPRDYCRRRGWEFHLSLRPQAFSHSYPWDEVFNSAFCAQHPEWSCYDAQGQRVARMSYAYPGVQEHMLGIIDEMVAYEPDGINLIFIRGLPLTLYEPIMVDGFKAKHGVDPRTLGEYDPRWLAYQAEALKPFMRLVKARLKPGMRLSAIVPGNQPDLARWGLDVAAWVREGVVDDLYPIGQRFNRLDFHEDMPEALDFEYFQQMEGRERIRLFATLYPWQSFRADPAAWRQRMASLLERGADGYCVWDGVTLLPQFGDLGLGEPVDIRLPRQPERSYPIHTVGAFRVDRYHPIEGF